MNNNDFETQVLTRLAVIEAKIDDYKQIKERSDSALVLAKENEKEIIELQEKIKWITRSVIGAIIVGVIGVIFLYLEMGLGIK